jgi:hypothetical protein
VDRGLVTTLADTAVDALTDAVSYYRRRNPWLVDPEQARQAEHRLREMLRESWRTGEPVSGSDETDIHRAAIRLLLFAEPIGVSEDVCELVTVAAEGFHPEQMDPFDMLIPYGFAHFARPQEFPHPEGPPPIIVNHLAWGVTTDVQGILLGLLGPSRFVVENDDRDIRFRQMMTVRFSDDPASVQDQLPYWRHAQAFWRLLEQRILTKHHEQLSRAARRRAVCEIQTAVVVTLRRTQPHRDHDDHLCAGVDWTHRWLVNGHWRSQWMPSAQRHEQRWIAPYVKGPADKPFVAKTRKFEFVR